MKRRVGITAAAIGALALAGTAVVVPATASQNSTDGTRITQASQAQQQAAAGESEQSAQAAQRGNGYFTANGVNIRKGPNTNRAVLGQGQNRQPIQVHSCGHGGGSWWHITNLATGVKGYVYWPNNVLLRSLADQPPGC